MIFNKRDRVIIRTMGGIFEWISEACSWIGDSFGTDNEDDDASKVEEDEHKYLYY